MPRVRDTFCILCHAIEVTYLKAGAWLALAFAAGGGAGAYWSTSSESEKSAPPAGDATEVAQPSTDSAEQADLRSEEREPASESSPHGSSPDEGELDEKSVDAELSGRSAADILWAFEQAYRDHEQRILLLEATLHEQMQATHAASEEAESSPGATEMADGRAPDEGASLGVENNWVSEEAVAAKREPVQRVDSVNAPFEEPVDERAGEEKQAAALLMQQQVVLLNHYQQVLTNDATQTRTSSPRGFVGSATTSGPEQWRSQARQDFNQRSSTSRSWVASGFDVYSR